MHGKLYNSIKVLSRGIRDYPKADFSEKLIKAKEKIIESKENIAKVKNLAELLGVEGDASRAYFQIINNLITQQKTYFNFSGRIKYPATDPTNALLSLSYGMVRVLVENALITIGLDPYVGFFINLDRRTSLALDVMEEFRAYIADRFVLNLINRKQINIKICFAKRVGHIY